MTSAGRANLSLLRLDYREESTNLPPVSDRRSSNSSRYEPDVNLNSRFDVLGVWRRL
jgi:hypothetical protein